MFVNKYILLIRDSVPNCKRILQTWNTILYNEVVFAHNIYIFASDIFQSQKLIYFLSERCICYIAYSILNYALIFYNGNNINFSAQ